jgi:hypothetical protein
MLNLNDDNFLLFAAKNYISPHYISEEFYTDIKRIKYIRRLIQKYNQKGELKERLILNHLILIFNVFETEACTRMLFLKMGEKNFSVLKTFLIYLNYMPEKVNGINGKDIISSAILIDLHIASILRQL